jgi:hypothetical protein
MPIDICQHRETQILIKVAQALRKLKGMPEQNNVSILHQEGLDFIGMPRPMIDSNNADRPPTTIEQLMAKGYPVPVKNCEACGTKRSVTLTSICQSCKDAVGGYLSMWVCLRCGWKNKLKKSFIAIWRESLRETGMTEAEIDQVIPQGTKEALGIKTMTDNGLR